jgi:hypothetical protein
MLSMKAKRGFVAAGAAFARDLKTAILIPSLSFQRPAASGTSNSVRSERLT